MIRRIFTAIALMGAAWAHADPGYIVSGRIVAVRIDGNGKGMVMFDQSLSGTRPSCVQNPYFNALAFDTNTAAGRAIYALLLSAKAKDAPLQVHGKGACDVYSYWAEDWLTGEEH